MYLNCQIGSIPVCACSHYFLSIATMNLGCLKSFFVFIYKGFDSDSLGQELLGVSSLAISEKSLGRNAWSGG